MLALLLALLAASPPGAETRLPVAAVEVHDGDTITLTVEGDRQTVRYLLIDAPELHHPARPEEELGREARDLNARLLALGPLRVTFDEETYDVYGRRLAYLWVEAPGGELLVNAELVRAGLALPLFIPPNERHRKKILDALRGAKARGAGLWSDGRRKVFTANQLWSEAPYLAGAFVTVRLTIERADVSGDRLLLTGDRVTLSAHRNEDTEPLWTLRPGQTVHALGKVLLSRGRCEIRLTSAEQILSLSD